MIETVLLYIQSIFAMLTRWATTTSALLDNGQWSGWVLSMLAYGVAVGEAAVLVVAIINMIARSTGPDAMPWELHGQKQAMMQAHLARQPHIVNNETSNITNSHYDLQYTTTMQPRGWADPDRYKNLGTISAVDDDSILSAEKKTG